MKKRIKNSIIPDLTEFTDNEGKKWIQTSTDDLFSTKELNDIINTIEKEREKDEVIIARIDFQKVDREFYDAATELQKRLKNQTELLKKYVSQSTGIIERKNKKLRELIDYIKKMHLILSYLNANPDEIDKIKLAPAAPAEEQTRKKISSVYEEVEEIVLPPDYSG
jgi:cellulose biosynthesis protein BcsQ